MSLATLLVGTGWTEESSSRLEAVYNRLITLGCNIRKRGERGAPMVGLDSSTRTAVYKLHKGLGVRQDGLPTLLLTTRLAELWGVTRNDSRSVLLAKVIYRLDQEFRKISDPRTRRAASVIYNLLPDPEMHDRDLGGRQELLRERHPDEEGYSQRSMSRMIQTLTDAVERSLFSPLPAIPELALLEIVIREAEFADELDRRIGPVAFARLVSRSYTAPVDEAAAAFLRLLVFVPRSHTDELIIARTADQGDWLCVFSNEAAQRAHQTATPRQPWSGRCTTMLGAELVGIVVDRWRSVGILVDPPAIRSSDAASQGFTVTALRLPPTELTRLANS